MNKKMNRKKTENIRKKTEKNNRTEKNRKYPKKTEFRIGLGFNFLKYLNTKKTEPIRTEPLTGL